MRTDEATRVGVGDQLDQPAGVAVHDVEHGADGISGWLAGAVVARGGRRAEVSEHGITVTALLPGATDSDFHTRAGMGDTKFGDNSWKNDKRLVARQGVDALFAGKDAVVGGDRATKTAVLRNRLLPERVEAARHARAARPSAGPDLRG